VTVERDLPTFVYAGPIKTGSTWLHAACQAHPEIYVPDVKDTWFFDRKYEKGLDWYASFFDDRPASAKAWGEIGGNYLSNPEVPERIAEDLPEARVFVTLRNPIRRAVSSYLFLRRNGVVDDSFEDAVDRRPGILENGLYAEDVQRFREALDDRFRVFVFDDLKEDPHAFARGIYGFLGVDDSFRFEEANERQNPASTHRNRWTALVAKKVAVAARSLNLHDLVGKLKHSDVVQSLLYRRLDDEDKDVLSPTRRQELVEYYADDVERIEGLICRDLTHWLEDE